MKQIPEKIDFPLLTPALREAAETRIADVEYRMAVKLSGGECHSLAAPDFREQFGSWIKDCTRILLETHVPVLRTLLDLEACMAQITKFVLLAALRQRWVTKEIGQELAAAFAFYSSGFEEWREVTSEVGEDRLCQVMRDALVEQYRYAKLLLERRGRHDREFIIPPEVPQRFKPGLLKIHANRLEKVPVESCIREACDLLAGKLLEGAGPCDERMLKEEIPAWVHAIGTMNYGWLHLRPHVLNDDTIYFTTDTLDDVKQVLAGRTAYWLSELFQKEQRGGIEVAAKQDLVVPFPTPAGVGWPDIEIRFHDGNTVVITICGKRAMKTHVEMGMASKKNRNPTVQWQTLEAFATGGGSLNWRNPRARPGMQKNVENLRRNLCAYFGLEESPFYRYKKGVGWQAKFSISAPR
jgi:hypothetical protein